MVEGFYAVRGGRELQLLPLLPLLNIFQGNIAAWLKKVGDKISPGDAIAELETDKVRVPRRLPPFLPDAFAFVHCRPRAPAASICAGRS